MFFEYFYSISFVFVKKLPITLESERKLILAWLQLVGNDYFASKMKEKRITRSPGEGIFIGKHSAGLICSRINFPGKRKDILYATEFFTSHVEL